METDKPFRILSIDGGGIKGLYSAVILRHLEEEFCTPNGQTISDYFDMICGTSTGGLIALALSIKKPTNEIVDFYATRGGDIFPNNTLIKSDWLKAKQLFWRSKYQNNVLKKELEKIFGHKMMEDAQNLLCIPAFNLTKSLPTVWKFPHKEGSYTREKEIKMLDVALSTSAAPTYFPIHEIHPHGRFIDGGVWANNPTLCGVLEAIEFFINQPLSTGEICFNNLYVLSVSSVNVPTAESLKGKLNRSVLGWNNKIINPFFEGQAFFTDKFMTNAILKLFPKANYHRIPSPHLSPDQAKEIALDKANHQTIKLLETLGTSVGQDYRAAKRDYVKPFFQQVKTYKP